MTLDLSELTHEILRAAKSAGAPAADAVANTGKNLTVEVSNGALEQAERAEDVQIGLRVLLGKRQAVVSASSTDKETILQMAERAVAMAKEAPEDPSVGLAEPAELTLDWDSDSLELCETGKEPAPAALQTAALEAEAAALNVKGVSKSQSAAASWAESSFFMAATNGFSGGYSRSASSVSCVAISGQGLSMERDYCGESRIHRMDLPTPTWIGQNAGKRAVERLNPKKPPTGSYPVLFDERISGSLIGHLLSAINGSNIVRGSSWLLDALGLEILPPNLDLIEDPSRIRATGSRPFDSEGLPVTKRKIIDQGRLTGWTLDLATARKLGMKSTGNASRGTSSPPSPSVGNLLLTPGKITREQLLGEMNTGLIVTSLIGTSINPTTGSYSRGASGFWLENGEITGPVNECTIAGNLRDMLSNIIPANDARTHLSRVIPSLLVEGLTIAGA